MTPAINMAKGSNIEFQVYEYAHDPAADSYGLEAAEKLGLDPDRVFKTLVIAPDGADLAVAVLPVSRQLDMKRCAKVLGSKKVVMAEKKSVERVTGYVLGGVSPLGQKKPLRTVIDQSASMFATVYVSAGRRGLEIELAPGDLRDLTDAQFASIAK